MKAVFEIGGLERFKGDAIGVFAYESDKKLDWQGTDLGADAKKIVEAAVRRGEFRGEREQLLAVHTVGGRMFFVAGLGKRSDFNVERVRRAAAKVAIAANEARLGSIAFSTGGICGNGAGAADLAAAIYEGAEMGTYSFDAYKSKKSRRNLNSITLLGESRSERAACERALRRAVIVCEAVTMSRDLGMTPAKEATPTMLADTAKRAAKKYGFRCRVLDRVQMEKLGMGALLGVARGSVQPPRFIIMEYGRRSRGRGRGRKTIVLVGKGLTFDSGGISLKPADNMHEMRFDKMGGCAVIGAMTAVARLKMPVHLVGLVPATENLPDGAAQKPGDVVTALNGKTIEVLNTDAEGRLILADALSYAARYRPDAVIDFATLTGAVVIALGHHCSAVMGNDQPLIDALKAAGEKTSERLWQLPIWDEYDEMIKGEVGDFANIGPNRVAGTILGGAFLSHFADKYKWAHVDIAGTAYGAAKVAPYLSKGPSGVGVRLVVQYLLDLTAE